MSDSTLVKFVAMVSGLLFLSLLAALATAHGYRAADGLAVTALGACAVCYGLQFGTERMALMILAGAMSMVSWALGLAAFAAYLMAR